MMNYKIIGKIGQGGHSIVYEGIDTKNNREVAIKEFKGVARNVNEEIQNQIKISTLMPNIVPKVYDSYVDSNGRKYLVQELIHGTNLRKLWQENRNWDFNWMSIYHILNLIKELHKHKYTHGDFGLANLIWTGKKLYVIDFDNLLDMKEFENLCSQLLKFNKDNPDELEDLKTRIWFIKESLCDDYERIINSANLFSLGDDPSTFANDNHGFEKFTMLYDWMKTHPCSIDYDEHKNTLCSEPLSYGYIDQLITEYNRIDNSMKSI